MGMAGGRAGAIRGDYLRLFDGGSVAGLADGELLERFATRRDEVAFEVLVARHGPMVLGVCRRTLADPHDVDDAFQATFLVLVRRAGSIREPDLVGPWLHGVATKVARRARADSARRLSRERRGDGAREPSAEHDLGGVEIRPAIDEEIGRLPEHYRRPVVLCDVEGLSREEAAQRLGWSLNMVRGRLDRARGRLRERLARRGLAPSGAGMIAMGPAPTLPIALAASTARVALAFSVGRMGMVTASASAVALSRGVLTMMMLSKWKAAASMVLSAGLVAAGSGMIAAQGPGDVLPPPDARPAAVSDPAAGAARPKPGGNPEDPAAPRSTADLKKVRIAAARQRLEAQGAFFAEGRITLDRYVGASRALMEAERDAAETKEARVAVVRGHMARLKRIAEGERANLEKGRSTAADVAEIQAELLDAEYLLAKELESPDLGRPAADPGGGPGPRSGERREAPDPGRAAVDPVRGPLPPHPTSVGGLVRGRIGGRSPLAEAINVMNSSTGGRGQEPLTEDEVIAAIRFWEPSKDSPALEATRAAFREIARTRQLPPDASFEVIDTMDPGGDFVFLGHWVRIRLKNGDFGTYAFPIRDRLIRSMTLEEAIARAEAELRGRGPLPGQTPLRVDLEGLKARIEKRDRRPDVGP